MEAHIRRDRNPTGSPQTKKARRSGTLVLLTALALAFLPSSAQAQAKCTAADFGCAPTGTCIITGTHEIGTSCHLDWGTQNVTVRGTLRAETLGDPFYITAGVLYIDGGKIQSRGDNVSSGGDITINLSGRFWMTGSGARVETDGNGGGGSVDITANDVLISGGGAIVTDGGDSFSCGSAGDVNLSAFGGPIILGGAATTIRASTPGYDCDGGFITMDAPSMNLFESIDGSGGAPGGITVVVTSGDFTLQPGATIDARGRGADEDFGNNGGDIDLFVPNGAIRLLGETNSDGSGGDGGGGDIQLDCLGDITISDDVSVAGVGTFASGGVIEMDTAGGVNIEANIDVSGGPQGDGGTIDVLADGDVTTAAGATLSTIGGAFGGGFITIDTESIVTIDGDLIARGGSSGDGGFIDVAGCRVTVSSNVDVEPGTIGSAGFIDFAGAEITLTATAHLEAEPCIVGACNTLTQKSGTPTIDPAAVVTPAAALVLDPSMAPCCGNGVLDDGLSSPIDAGEECEDGNGSYCDGCSPSCTLEAVPPCAGDGNECTQDCLPQSGCVYKKLSGVPCADEPGGNVCTTDVCQSGVCTHPPNTCDDGIDCTVDSCDPILGCQATNSDVLCDDSESCTTEYCDPGSGDPQTGCVTGSVADGTVCDDGTVCTTDDRCLGGTCVPQGPALECDDGDECTLNNCHPVLGCLNDEDPVACDCLDEGGSPLPFGDRCMDGDRCTVDDVCDGGGSCVSGTVCPDDGNPCTTESCSFGFCIHNDTLCPGSGACVEGEPCSDGTACTVGTCTGGECVSAAEGCDDGDECNGLEACHPLLGCRQFSHPPAGNPICEGYVEDAFTCYRARRAGGTAPFVPISGVSVEDEFWTRDVDVKRPGAICLPTSFQGGDPEAVAHDDWMLSYRVKTSSGGPSFGKQTHLEVVNALGTTWVDAKKPDMGMVPTAGEVGVPPAPAEAPDPDYFSCYKVGKTRGTPKFVPVKGLTIEDAFGALTIDVKKPMRLCNPANVNGLVPGAPGHATHLLCYRIRTSAETPRFPITPDVYTDNVLGTGMMDAVRISEVCLPSTVTPVEP